MKNNKVKIVIASVLKPIDDPRMYYKFGITLAETNKYHVNIIGYPSKNTVYHPNISFFPHKAFKRLSFGRLQAQYNFAKTLFHLKPELTIVNTPELAVVTIIFRILFGFKFIVDIRENYARNIIWSHRSGVIRKALGMLMVLAERLSFRLAHKSILAEKGYRSEMKYLDSAKTVILENKALAQLTPKTSRSSRDKLRLLYSGTVAESYGIWDSVNLCQKLVNLGINLELRVIGHCPNHTLFKNLMRLNYKWLKLTISLTPIPYPTILESYSEIDYALIAYQPNPSNINCIPTKVYECLLYKIPMILKRNSPWLQIAKDYQAGITIDFDQPNAEEFLLPTQYKFYYKTDTTHLSWERSEANMLLETINLALSK
jgi:hypothetical protein